MNEQDLQGILNKLNAQAESLRKKQDISKQIDKIDGWIKALQEKSREIVTFGAAPVVDVTSKIAALKAERDDLKSMLTPASLQEIQSLVEPTQWKEPLSEEETKELAGLLQVMDTLNMSVWSHQERWYQYDAWACRWRILINRHPKEVPDRSVAVKQVYGKIRDLMKADGPQLWYIQALDRTANVDWTARLQECETEMQRLAGERADQALFQENSQDMSIWTLLAAVREYRAAGEEFLPDEERKLRHQVRETAKHKHLREEVAQIVEPLRTLLEPEFSFLWPKEEVEEVIPSRSLSNREILARIMRRMKSKTLIGASHGPFDAIYKGVPEQDKGRAKDMLYLLGKVGVLRFKDSVIGIRISIEPKKVPVADRLINGEDTGIQAIDELLAGEVKV